MQNPTTDIQEMIKELNRFQLPGSMMESFEMYREEAFATASREFSRSQLSWSRLAEPLSRSGRPQGFAARCLRPRHVHRESSGVGGPSGNRNRAAGIDLRNRRDDGRRFGISGDRAAGN